MESDISSVILFFFFSDSISVNLIYSSYDYDGTIEVQFVDWIEKIIYVYEYILWIAIKPTICAMSVKLEVFFF